MPKDQQKRSTPFTRQQPISCRSCRSRKLRCNRECPCSNCVSRGIVCELETVVRNQTGANTSSESELLERINKLERIVESQKICQNESVKSHPPIPDTVLRQIDSPPVLSETDTPEPGTLDTDIAYLESIYSEDDLQVNFVTC